MFDKTKALVIALVVSVALLCAAGVALKAQGDTISMQRTALREQTTRANKAEALVLTVRKQVTVSHKDAQTARKELGDALRKDPAAASTPVPAAVRDSLCKRLRCADTGPMPTPTD